MNAATAHERVELMVAPCSACTAAHTGLADGTCGTVLAGQDPFNSCSGTLVCDGTGFCK